MSAVCVEKESSVVVKRDRRRDSFGGCSSSTDRDQRCQSWKKGCEPHDVCPLRRRCVSESKAFLEQGRLYTSPNTQSYFCLCCSRELIILICFQTSIHKPLSLPHWYTGTWQGGDESSMIIVGPNNLKISGHVITEKLPRW